MARLFSVLERWGKAVPWGGARNRRPGRTNRLHERLQRMEQLETRALLSIGGIDVEQELLGSGLAAYAVGDAANGLGEIRGSKWDDLDGNGSWNTNEPGLENWQIYLDLNQDKVFDPLVEPVTLTGVDGAYSFTNLAPGTYWVGEVSQPGWRQTYPSPLPPNEYDIELVMDPLEWTPGQLTVFQNAAARWSQVVIGDVPDVRVSFNRIIDDLEINANAGAIDGPGGILGYAYVSGYRAGSYMPYQGYMMFDTADMADLELAGQLGEVIVHEMGHLVGVGSMWHDLGLVSGSGTADPRFIGPAATAEYNAIFGNTETSVPIENIGTYPDGTTEVHWRESVFDNELMTGFLNSGVPNPLSRITIGQLEDLGYEVDYGAADPYVMPIRRAGLQSDAPRERLPSLVWLEHEPTVAPLESLVDRDAVLAEAAAEGPMAATRVWGVHVVNLAPGQIATNINFGNTEVIPIVEFTDDAATVAETAGAATITARLSEVANHDVVVPYTLDGTATKGPLADYTINPAVITIPAGSLTATLTVTINNDSVVEADEDAIVTLGQPSGATLGTRITHTLTITNDDSARFAIDSVTGFEDGGPLTFTVTLSNPVDTATSVFLSTSDNSAKVLDNDYLPVSNVQLTFPSGTTSRTFVVAPVADDKVELDEAFEVEFTGIIGSGRRVTVDGTPGVATILNDDNAELSIDNVIITEGNYGMTTAAFTVTLNRAVDSKLSLDYSTVSNTASAGSDFAAAGGTVRFMGNAAGQQTIFVQVQGDRDRETDETFYVLLGNLSAFGRAVTLADPDGTATIVDDDDNETPISTGIGSFTVNEDAPDTVIDLQGVFQDDLDPAGSLNYSIHSISNPGLFASATIDSDLSTLRLSYTPNANGVATLTVRATDSGGLFVDTPFTVTVNPVNDSPTFVPGSSQVVTEDVGPQSIVGWATRLSAGPNDESGQQLQFIVINDNPELFSVPPSISANGTLNYTPASNANGFARVTAVLTDNGGTASGGIASSEPREFTITVLPINDAPRAETGAFTTVEDTGLTVDLWLLVNDAETPDASLVFSVAGSFNGSAVLLGDGHTVLFTPALDYSGPAGQAGFFYRVTDTGDGSQGSISVGPVMVGVTVTAVADAPSIIAPISVHGAEAAGMLLPIDAALGDPDGSETLSVIIGGLPAGATLSMGASSGGGTWTIVPGSGSLGGLTLMIPDDGEFDLTVTARARESSNGSVATATTSVLVVVDNVDPVPTISQISQPLLVGSLITATGLATDAAGVHDTLFYNWMAVREGSSTPAATASGVNVRQFRFTPVENGRYLVLLEVSDEDGGAAVTSETTYIAESLGTVDFRELPNLDLAEGEQWYRLETANEGFLSIQASFPGPTSTVSMELYAADGVTRLTDSQAITGGRRIDRLVQPGETYYFRIGGTLDDVLVRVANMVLESGDTVLVFGTNLADEISFDANTTAPHLLTANGVSYSFNQYVVSQFIIGGSAGRDSLRLDDSDGDDAVVVRPGRTVAGVPQMAWTTMTNTGGAFMLEATGFELVFANARGTGYDTAEIHDTDAPDKFKAEGDTAFLRGGAYFTRTRGYEQVVAISGSEGDLAVLEGTATPDIFLGGSDESRLYSERQGTRLYDYTARAFEEIRAYGRGGIDRASLFDSEGDDVFRGMKQKAEMARLDGTGPKVAAWVFEHVSAFSQNGGTDTARLFDTPGGDVFEGEADWGQLYATDPSFRRAVSILAFERVKVYLTLGGPDTRTLRGVEYGLDFILPIE